jgi:protection of telomeres protein 1
MLPSKSICNLLHTPLTFASLRADPNLLSQVKEQLFKLWGDLEEQKAEKLQQKSKGNKNIPASSIESESPVSKPTRKAGDMPDPDSDGENERSYSKSPKKSKNSVLTERDSNITTSSAGLASNPNTSDAKLAPKNKSFTCCIKQYGVKVDEHDPAKADAGDGQRWQRIFGLFSTQIL